MKAQQSPMIAKSILLMLTWKTNTQLNDETGNPCVCVFFLQFLIWNLTSLCHLKVVLLQCSAVVLKIKIICLSGGLLLRPCSQDWRLRGWLTKARRNAWHEDTSSFLPFLQIRSLWGALEDQQAEVHTVSVWCKTLDFFSYFSLYQSSSLMLSTVYWLIKKNKENINLTCSSFLPAIPLRWACCLDAGQDWGWWERAHQTWEYLKTDICVGAFFWAWDLWWGARPRWRRRSKTTRMYINEVISHHKNWAPVERNNRSNAEAKELDRHGLLHLLHTICSNDLISSRASRWTYPLGSWSTTQAWMIGCDLNGQIHKSPAHHFPTADRIITRVTCTFFFSVRSVPDLTTLDQTRLSSVPGWDICSGPGGLERGP